jgi:hypothetical protein
MRELIQPGIWIMRIAILSILSLALLPDLLASGNKRRLAGTSELAVTTWAAANVAFVIFLCFNHPGFPLNLDVMESTIFQHFLHARGGQPVYPEPSSSYSPLAYNPLFYFFAVPFSWILGDKLSTLRVVAILAMTVIGLIIFLVTKRTTNSVWWGFISVGVYCAAYRVMDAYLDSAHSDSWFVCSALLGTLILDRSRSRRWNFVGLFLLVCSFWFKQHGALFVIGGVFYLTIKEGPVRALPYWVLAILCVPVFYWFAGPWLFGSHFHYFTYTVPSQWTEISLRIIPRYLGFVLIFYGTLAGFAFWNIAHDWRINQKVVDIWRVQLVFAMATALMGCLDSGSSDNIFIPLGVFLIIEGIRGIFTASKAMRHIGRLRIEMIALIFVFAQLVYDPRTVVVSGDANEKFADLISTLDNLHASVYAPSLGQLEKGFILAPAAHWASLEDMIRGPGLDTRNNPIVVRLLYPCLHPDSAAYVLTNFRLHDFPPLAFLEPRYVLDTDFGDRFKSLRVLPKRFDHLWPRYLYRFVPAEVK